MQITAFDQSFSICKMRSLPTEAPKGAFWFAAQTDEEFSFVCQSEFVPQDVMERSDHWRAMRIEGVLDFSLVGILAGITDVLSRSSIPVFAVSTYNTDYIFVQSESFERALEALCTAGYSILRADIPSRFTGVWEGNT